MKCLLCESNDLIITGNFNKKNLLALWLGVYPNAAEELKLDRILFYQCTNCSLKFFDPQLAGGEKFYSELGKFDWYYNHSGKTEYDYVQKHIKENNSVLDIGSGRGVLFTKIKKNVNYTGIELSTKAVQLAKEAGINVKQEDLLLHAQANKSHYDIVCLFQVIEHLTELDAFLKSIHLTLKSKGLFVIATPNNDGFISTTPNYTFNLPPHHTILWTEKSLQFLAKKYDFDVLEVEQELLQDVHKDSAYSSYLVAIIKKILFIPNLLIDNSKSHSLIVRIVNRLLRISLFQKLILPILKKRVIYGQSIIVTLQKK